MKRFAMIVPLVLAAALWLVPTVGAQPTSQVLVKATSNLATFVVDGVEYRGAASFLWPRASKHILEYRTRPDGFQYANLHRTRMAFGGWTVNQGTVSNPVVTVTADQPVHTFTVTTNVEHEVQVIWYDGAAKNGTTGCGEPGFVPPPQLRIGVVFVGGVCYWDNALTWLAEGSVSLSVFPYPGYIFLGWTAGTTPNAFLRTTDITGPTVLVARFSPAKRVNFRTDPVGLRIRVDRAEVRTTDLEPCEPNNLLPIAPPPGIRQPCVGEFDFLPGSTHVLGAPSPQVDKYGRTWILQGFSNGLGQDSLYKVADEIYPEETIVAKFARGVPASFTTKPTGLKLRIDGRDNWPEPYFVFAPGSKHTVSAPAEQVDARGRKYVFRRWSNDGPPSQELVVAEDAWEKGLHMVAEYDILSQVVVRSNPLGATVMVDGNACVTPCRIDRADGTEVMVEAPAVHAVSELHRFEFLSWSDGGARQHAVAVRGVEATNLTAGFQVAYKLVLGSDPPEAARFRFQPESADGFFPADTLVTVMAEGEPGFRFRRWDYDLSGTTGIGTVMMSRSRTVVARFDKVPFIAAAGIRNAAGGGDDAVVAPGSLITISGANLAPYYEAGPTGPILSQALAGVSVTVGGRILPLLFVSPPQINAQLPRDLGIGDQELRVIRVGQPDVLGKFTVVPSAPGLFSKIFDSQQFVSALHEDGTPIEPTSPARPGEQVTLLGTGFGAYQFKHPDGFALPAAFPLQLPVELDFGGTPIEPQFAGGVAGQVGLDMVRFRIPEQLPEQAMPNIRVRVRIDGRSSNASLLPLQP
jgi:uncharacterized protein (TIGR03437 family)